MVDFHLTQALTGHGCFPDYLLRFGKADSEVCWFCGHARDDATHTLFECDAWAERRRTCCIMIGEEITADNLVQIMLDSEERWNVIHRFVKEVLKAKEEEERRENEAYMHS
ncbi:uncharacterized protein LOC112592069 [Melanaphis sacchari]|uniref:uncharacterized protein LOC112592069 n=1 Tax=Melanaphis sacchari TaxID=742174 RepID=UPI000DC14D84|nr:uncharacterized protein LOC112592069 [Melanaphis sacchari]